MLTLPDHRELQPCAPWTGVGANAGRSVPGAGSDAASALAK